MKAMGVLEPMLFLEKSKLNLYHRLLTNDFTKEILHEEEIKLKYAGTFIVALSESLKVNINNETIESLSEKARIRISCIENEKANLKKKQIGEIAEIASLLDKCDVISRSKLFLLIKH
jgi:hypothetical protein